MPFGEYKDFADCVGKNQDKENPEGYCAIIHKNITGKYPNEMEEKMTSAKEALKKEILSLQKKVKLYKELYDEEPEAKEEACDNMVPEKEAVDEMKDMDKVTEILEALSKRVEAIEQSINAKKEEVKPAQEEPKKEAEEEKKDEVKKEEAPVEGEVKKEEEPKKEQAEDEEKEDEEKEDEKKPIPPVMEKLNSKRIRIESTFNRDNKIKEMIKKVKLM